MSPTTVLLISDEPSLKATCQEVMNAVPDLRLATIGKVLEAGPFLRRDGLAVVLTHLPRDGDVEEVAGLLQAITTTKRPVATVVLAEQCPPERVARLLRQGAADCLSWPADLPRLGYLLDALTVRARCSPARPAAPVPALHRPAGGGIVATDLVGMERVMEQVRLVAPQDTTLLLVGETGTGKTRLAQLIHDLSGRRDEPLLVVNCGALAANLVESEMFGHVRGAFTGAERDRTGKFAAVGRGTLLLDEIDTLSLPLQGKLLRAVEERVFEPVGSNKSQPVRARLIAASNRTLEKEVEAGRFRPDLYYRLNVVRFSLSPLRERRGVIPDLVNGFIAELAGRNARPAHRISAEALSILEAYAWPGNIRELRNVIERAVALCPGSEIQVDDLPEAVISAVRGNGAAHSGPANGHAALVGGSALGQAREEAEMARIAEALRKHGNNRVRAAAELGICRRTLYKKLHRYGMGVLRWGPTVMAEGA